MEYIGKLEEDNLLIDESQIIIYGSGVIGKRIFSYIEANIGKNRVVAFCDGNEKKWGSFEEGVEVISLKEATEKYGQAAYLVGSCRVREIVEILQEAEIRKIHITIQ